jgi:two-component system NtrC family sensor kinase
MDGTGVIQTIKQNCRRCYTCVRECPAKAIRIEGGQARVVSERCIACGNCTMVCSQNAKAYRSGIERTAWLLEERAPVAALLAPSFPAEFGAPAEQVAGALRQAGFAYVIEVAQGADVVSAAYAEYLAAHTTGLHIATACPAVVEYVRKYNPALTHCLIPIVSPMMASAFEVKRLYDEQVRCVFIGPCVAKKLEAQDPLLPPVIDEVLTLSELRRLFAQREVDVDRASPAAFDPPLAGHARVFPLPGGLLESADLERGVYDPEVLVLSGHDETTQVLRSLREEDVQTTLLVEALMCRGCYSGPGMQTNEAGHMRRQRLGEYVTECLAAAPEVRDGGDGAHGRDGGEACGPVVAPADSVCLYGLMRAFTGDDQRYDEPTETEIREILARTNKFFPEDELDCGACGYPTCRDKAVAVHCGMAEEAMCLPFVIEQAERVCHELNVPWEDLRDVHRHLINTEKLASMGQMAAGVAHELNNPLSTILLYTHILGRKLEDRDDLRHDLTLMSEESQRCKKIIGNLLDFARQSRVNLATTDVGPLVRQAVDAAAGTVNAAGRDVRLEVAVEPGLVCDLDHDQMAQVLVNLVKNALEAMEGHAGTVRVSATGVPDQPRVRFSVADEGCGIRPEATDKVFQPFFTTKSIGKGTGLGLPISYGIVKMHRGTIWFDSEPGQGTTFHIELPATQTPSVRSVIDGTPAHDPVR